MTTQELEVIKTRLAEAETSPSVSLDRTIVLGAIALLVAEVEQCHVALQIARSLTIWHGPITDAHHQKIFGEILVHVPLRQIEALATALGTTLTPSERTELDYLRATHSDDLRRECGVTEDEIHGDD